MISLNDTTCMVYSVLILLKWSLLILVSFIGIRSNNNKVQWVCPSFTLIRYLTKVKRQVLTSIEVNYYTNFYPSHTSFSVYAYMVRFEELFLRSNVQKKPPFVVAQFIYALQNDIKWDIVSYFLMSIEKNFYKDWKILFTLLKEIISELTKYLAKSLFHYLSSSLYT